MENDLKWLEIVGSAWDEFALRAKMNPDMCCVYALELEDGKIKIGMTRDLERRKAEIARERWNAALRTYRTDYTPQETAAEIEQLCHAAFEEFKIRGEYFNITFEAACAELDKYKDKITAANLALEKFREENADALKEFENAPHHHLARRSVQNREDKPAPVDDDFTRREKVEILLELLNFTDVPALKNKIISQIVFLLSDEYENLLEQMQNEFGE